MEWKIVSLLLTLTTTVATGFMFEESSVENLRRLLTDNFSMKRHHTTNPQGKTETREFLVDTYTSYGLSVLLQDFPTDKHEYPGKNVIGTLPGRYTGTPLDKPVVLGGHYDTRPDTPGVDDNGSGLAALLEAARIITSQPCKLDHTVMFVSFDFEEWATEIIESDACLKGLCGSRAYVKDILLPYLNESGIPIGNFQGAINLDQLMNYNNSVGSQVKYEEFAMVPGAETWYEDIANNEFRGNFISVIGREDHDSHLYSSFLKAWGDTSKYKTVSMFLPVRDIAEAIHSNPFWPAYEVYAVRSDHASFWLANPDLRAIHITDTAQFRGNMVQCYHQECDNLQFVTNEGLGFLKKTTDAVTSTVLTLAGARDNCTDDATQSSAAPPSGWLTLQVAIVAASVIAFTIVVD